jgi:hypothetical protein
MIDECVTIHRYIPFHMYLYVVIAALILLVGYQKFMMIMIFNPNSATCELAQDWPRRKDMGFRERFNYELTIWLFIALWPVLEISELAVNAITFCRRTK